MVWRSKSCGARWSNARRRLEQALGSAIQQVDRILKAYRPIARASHRIVIKVARLIEVQSDESRYELYDIIEDGARRAAMRMETVGLAFSGGGIRSATFNLGFLQGLASLRLLKRFDYLSTVSGGGYIGAWFAAWVRREGGSARDPERPSPKFIRDEIEKEKARRRAEFSYSRSTPFNETVKEWIKQESDKIREQERQKLLDEYRAKVAANEALPEEKRDADLHEPSDVDMNRVADQRIAKEKAKIRMNAQKRYREEGLKKIEDQTGNEVEAALKKNYEAEIQSRRQRTSAALNNVEKQLDTSRVVQKKAARRWVTSREIANGREQIESPPPLLDRVVDEEPEPIHHLRSYSNYLAPKIGLLSIDTWTMVSVYLRNLLLIQFILLPMILAAIAVPRLLLILFASRTTEPILTLLGGWLDAHPGWLVRILVIGGCVAILTVTKLVDYFANAAVKRVEKRYRRNEASYYWITEWAIIALMALGMAATAKVLTENVLPSLARIWFSQSDPRMLPTLIRWLSRNSWIVMLVLLTLLIVLASVFRRWLFKRLVASIARLFTQRVKGWTIILIFILGMAGMSQATPWLIAGLASVPGWLPPLLLAAVIAIWLWLPAGVSRRVTTALLSLGVLLSTAQWLNGEKLIFACTFLMAAFGFWRTYKTVALIRESRRPASPANPNSASRFELPFSVLWEQILIPFTLVAFGVSLLFARPGNAFFTCPIPYFGEVFNPETWGNSKPVSALWFGRWLV